MHDSDTFASMLFARLMGSRPWREAAATVFGSIDPSAVGHRRAICSIRMFTPGDATLGTPRYPDEPSRIEEWNRQQVIPTPARSPST
jgi:hypothetical protein